MKALLCVVVLCAAPSLAIAQDAPLRGQLTAKASGGNSISYECLQNAGVLHCDFTQVQVFHPTPMTQEQIDNGTAQLLQEPTDPVLCGKLHTALEKLKQGQDPDPADPFDWHPSDGELQDGINFIGQFQTALCNDRSEASIRAYLQSSEALTAKTCNVSAVPFDLDFTYDPSSKRWDSISQPEGPCATITSAFWERPTDPIALASNWNYHQLRTVTLSTGTDLLGDKCADKKNEDVYFIWQSKTERLQCENVKFGLF